MTSKLRLRSDLLACQDWLPLSWKLFEQGRIHRPDTSGFESALTPRSHFLENVFEHRLRFPRGKTSKNLLWAYVKLRHSEEHCWKPLLNSGSNPILNEVQIARIHG